MNYKLGAGLLAVVVGVILLGYGFYGKFKMNEARGDIDTTSSFIPDNPLKSAITGKLHAEVDQYTLPVALCFVGGVAFIVCGGVLIYKSNGRK